MPAGFRLDAAVQSHGWYDLAPFKWTAAVLERVLDVDGAATLLRIQMGARGLEVSVDPAAPGSLVRAQVSRMLNLDEDLEPLYALCDPHPGLAWARARGAGRLLRAPTAFEDLIKVLLTTNCSWSLTRAMVSRLVAALGAEGRAFPTAERMAREDERFYREVVRAGYRAAHLVKLARAQVDGELDLDAMATGPEPEARSRGGDFETLRARLLELPGYGPYATDNLLRLLGAYDGLGLDSWCRAKLKKLAPRVRRIDAFAERRYRPFGRYRGLVMWLELTADWHLSAPPAW